MKDFRQKEREYSKLLADNYHILKYATYYKGSMGYYINDPVLHAKICSLYDTNSHSFMDIDKAENALSVMYDNPLFKDIAKEYMEGQVLEIVLLKIY